MSYLDQPRLYFSGKFLADPSTINNTPDNYNSNHTFPTEATIETGLFTPITESPPNSYNYNNVDLFWNPNGTGAFGLVDCKVNKISYADGTEATSPGDDALIEQPVTSNNGSAYTQAKLVDLDPMQQNVSEIWGMNVGVGDVGRGDFAEIAFISIWLQAQGVPPSDTAGSALYQSTLTNLRTGNDYAQLVARSRFLQDVADAPALSMCFSVRSHNTKPQTYLIDKDTLAAMKARGVPESTLDKLQPLTVYASHPTSTAGEIPTLSYFKKLLVQQLGKNDPYEQTIEACAKQPYTKATPFDFAHGQIAGVIGVQRQGEPAHFTAARMMAPSPGTDGKYGIYNPVCYFAPFKILDQGVSSVALNLANSLPSKNQGDPFDRDKLHTLKLCYFDLGAGDEISAANAKPLPGAIDYADFHSFYLRGAAIVDHPIDAEHAGKPLGLVAVDDQGHTEVLLQEDAQGLYVRADQFVFRMEAGTDSAEQTVDFYVTRFGEPAAGEVLDVAVVPPDEAVRYTNATPGTGGSAGVNNLSAPQSVLSFEQPAPTDAAGKTTLTVRASDPGMPRDYVDGQVYFLKYTLESADESYVQCPDDIISIQVYQQDPLSFQIPKNSRDNPTITWNNGVRDILAQYGKLYPIMSFLGMEDYATVTSGGNLESIKKVLSKSRTDPEFMPVTRDLSESRKAVILSWIEHGAPEGASPDDAVVTNGSAPGWLHRLLGKIFG